LTPVQAIAIDRRAGRVQISTLRRITHPKADVPLPAETIVRGNWPALI
jgi:hypothetical protein